MHRETLVMNFSQLSIFVIALLLKEIVISVVSIQQQQQQQQHVETSQPLINITKQLSFPNFNPNKNPRIHLDLKLLGDAKLIDDQGAIHIPSQNLHFKAGRALFASPVRLFDPISRTPASFSTTFSFQIFTTSDNNNNSIADHGGSGLTFIAVPDELTVGRPGPWLGMLNDACDDDYKAFAVEFDTRHNPEFGDPNNNHIGINLGTIVSSTTVDASAAGFSFNDGSVHRAWIDYDGLRRWIDIRIASGNFPSKPLLSSPLDLSDYLREYMFVGFSASTGTLTQIHSIRSWNFSSQIESRLRLPGDDACVEKLAVGPREAATVKRKAPSAFMVFMAVVALCLVVVLNMYCNGKRREGRQAVSIPLPEKNIRPRPPNKPRRFPTSELASATRGFSEGEVLGSDDKGVFYRGLVGNGTHVAVKRVLGRYLDSVGLDRRRVVKEIRKLSRVRHPNLVTVRGWCCDKRESMVVYEYVQNGSLDKWLFASGVLPWTRRLKVLREVAEALTFLHEKGLSHKNVKTSSVLLDVSFRAMLGDFGFGSSWVEPGSAQKGDVYEFGILALEVVAGRRRKEEEEEEEEKELLELVWRRRDSGEICEVIDRRMRSVHNEEHAIRVLEIGLLCTMGELKTRPCMEEVVSYLSWEREIPELPRHRPVALFPHSSGPDLCSIYPCAPFQGIISLKGKD